ncbi:hypothetical protein PsYK624_064060 [Phanerochaete sordida]|uniref:Uncharacterized protein n=1 Tax=Phanerochaete sordida TaxID=48140 RepID=A0A9P3G6P4_9APHY|nr:hypothetical protein PsYK624_064060 [Phanerochaete sordida]
MKDSGTKQWVDEYGFVHRDLIAVMKEKIQDPESWPHFHIRPYELWVQPDEAAPATRIYSDLYTCDAFLKAHNELQVSIPEDDELERVVVGFMFASDKTNLSQFGTDSAHPLYLAFGNDSKERRVQQAEALIETVAWFQHLGPDFDEYARKRAGKRGPGDVFNTHCDRQFFHAQWATLLNKRFCRAYEHGVVISCPDGKDRRFFPRIFTYSADYMEKIAIALIRNAGFSPCPRCYIKKADLHRMGQKIDMRIREEYPRIDEDELRRDILDAIKKIQDKGLAIGNKQVEDILQGDSLLAIKNAFWVLQPLGFNLYQMLTPDLLHEMEIGVWKAVFWHLLRILDCEHPSLKKELDRRFRSVPAFARAIRKISSNRSEPKRLTAHDWEDMLQVAIPVFDGLLPEPHNAIVRKLLFTLAHWHGMAKLRAHTEDTLKILEATTVTLGQRLREFQKKTCDAYVTRELEKEAAARERREKKAAEKAEAKAREKRDAAASGSSGAPVSSAVRKDESANGRKEANETAPTIVPGSQPEPTAATSLSTSDSTPQMDNTPAKKATAQGKAIRSARKRKVFNLNFPKVHFLGDYVPTIRLFGTIEGYSTDTYERLHKTSKSLYPVTDHRDFTVQLAKKLRRTKMLRRIRYKVASAGGRQLLPTKVRLDRTLQYNIGKTEKHKFNIVAQLRQHPDDPALKNFEMKLKAHLLPRIQQLHGCGNISTEEDPDELVIIVDDTIYEHREFHINYTTYDIRRSYDVLRPHTGGRDVMVLAQTDSDDQHAPRFWESADDCEDEDNDAMFTAPDAAALNVDEISKEYSNREREEMKGYDSDISGDDEPQRDDEYSDNDS